MVHEITVVNDATPDVAFRPILTQTGANVPIAAGAAALVQYDADNDVFMLL